VENLISRETAAGAGFVLDSKWLTQFSAHLVGDHSRDRVDAAARCSGDDNTDRVIGKIRSTLLPPRRERPRCRTAEQRNEFAPSYFVEYQDSCQPRLDRSISNWQRPVSREVCLGPQRTSKRK
jgi:hypothetical protein